jgi:hypothetical protein
MEIPEHLYNWLYSIGMIETESNSSKVSEDLLKNLESGQAFTKLIKRLNQIKVTVT